VGAVAITRSALSAVTGTICGEPSARVQLRPPSGERKYVRSCVEAALRDPRHTPMTWIDPSRVETWLG
jgi:hypothetical protein